MGQQEREHQRESVLASAHARSLGLLREVCGFAAALREVTAHWQRDPAMQARLTVWGVTERRTNLMDEHVQRAEAVRQVCIAAALQAYEEAGISGLCHERMGVHTITLSCGAVADGCLPPRWLAR